MVTVAELGAMQLGGQVRAIAGQGLDPFSFLILPRAVAFALACFTLGVVFVVVALVACLTGLSAQPGEQVTTLLPRGFVRGVLAVMLTSLVLSLAA